MTTFDPPRLLADIGGSYARFALEVAPGRFEQTVSLPCAEHADFHAAVTSYLRGQTARPRHAAIAIANPVEGDEVRMTNYHWQFSIEQMRERLQLDTLVVVNDFTALAMAVPQLGAQDKRQVGGGQAREAGVVGVLGAGSGLGVSGLIPADKGWVALGAEGGHTSFAPHDERELAILRHAWQQFPHVSFERLLSGPGLELIHRGLAARAGLDGEPVLQAPEITRRGLEGGDVLCAEAIEVFCAMLGTAASNLAVSLGALGGIYIGGSIVPRLGTYFERSPFRARFEDKGRFRNYLRAIPTYVITAADATFTGASAILQAQLRTLEDAPASALLAQIQRGLDQLSPAERRVADHVLVQPRSALNEPIAEIARAAGVSQPTVIRFCRSLGCEGLSDFKLRLASGLTATVPVTHAQVTRGDSMADLGAKVLGNTASAILQVRDQLNRDATERAIDVLNTAGRIDVHAVGDSAPVALDAQYKFLRLGISCHACTDAQLQKLAAAVLRPQDVVLIISSDGRIDELIDVADTARARGATVVAITAGQSPLARKADIALIVDHPEDTSTQLPMVSRILHLLVIDILAVGVSMRRQAEVEPGHGSAAAEKHGTLPPAAGGARALPGVSASLPYARLTSHSRR